MIKVQQLYGENYQEQKNILSNLSQKFKNDFNSWADDFFSASGRAELLGNHTDHNRGCVLVGAIDKDIKAACAKREDNKIIIKSQGFKDIVLNASDYDKRKGEEGKSVSIVRGIIKAFNSYGYNIGGLNASTCSNIFTGAGMSSSAAFEVLLCKIFSYYYCNDSLTPMQCAKAAQYAESEYFGKPCGLLDQSGIALGGINFIDFKDTLNPDIKTINAEFKHYDMIITYCGGDHSNLTPHYAAVKAEMQSVSRFFGKQYLREVEYGKFTESLPVLCKSVSGRAVLRAFHFFEENIRVKKAAAYINSDMQAFLDMVNQSGISSYMLLQNCHVPQDDIQPVPLALKLSKQYLADKGAVRVHGGGFAGTILAFVPKSSSQGYIEYMSNVFGKENIIKTNIRNAGAVRLEI